MIEGRVLRMLACGALLTAAVPAARAEGTFDPPPGAHFNLQKLQRVGDYLRDQIAQGKIPGAIVLIRQHGKTVYHEHFGVRDVATVQNGAVPVKPGGATSASSLFVSAGLSWRLIVEVKPT